MPRPVDHETTCAPVPRWLGFATVTTIILAAIGAVTVLHTVLG